MKTRIAKQSVTVLNFRYEEERREISSGVYTAHRQIPDGTRTATVELHIDVDALIAELGRKALRAKGRKAREVGGLVEVVVVRGTERHTPEAEAR
jgi:hypothetical protein